MTGIRSLVVARSISAARSGEIVGVADAGATKVRIATERIRPAKTERERAGMVGLLGERVDRIFGE
jgi:hypothetical protein